MAVVERRRVDGGLWESIKDRDLVGRWAKKLEEELARPAFQRDPEFIGKLLPFMDLFARYFDGEVHGLENVPRTGPVLLVGNHSGGTLTPDTSVFLAAFFRELGLERPLSLLALDALFGIPYFETLCRKLGLVPASEGNADRALAEGNALLVYPGGAHEAFRPWSERHRIDFAGRKGFIRLALRTGTPVVPVVAQGGHDTVMVLSRGERLAKTMGMDRIRLGIFPVLFQLPWGVSTPALPGVPLPAKITVNVLPPLDWSAYGPEAADDPEILGRCYEEITSVMQARLDAMARDRPTPLLDRLRS